MQISFIIPVYNVENYLEACVDSILSQADERCEIILVDDGSTDASPKICDRYAQLHSTVRTFHTENGGASAARNYGLEQAKGAYVAFVDSDDLIAPGSVQQLLTWSSREGTDICFLEGAKLFPDGTKVSLGDRLVGEEMRGKSREAALRHLATRPKYPGSACTKLFRREFLLSNSLRFACGRVHGEDLSFTCNCILAARSFDALPFAYYEYRQDRENSVTNSRKGTKVFADMCRFVEDTVHMLTENQKPRDAAAACAMSFAAYEYGILCWHYGALEKAERRNAQSWLKQYAWVMDFGQTSKLKLIRLCVQCIGINATAWLLGKYMAIR